MKVSICILYFPNEYLQCMSIMRTLHHYQLKAKEAKGVKSRLSFALGQRFCRATMNSVWKSVARVKPIIGIYDFNYRATNHD